jgi:hypothetical protein
MEVNFFSCNRASSKYKMLHSFLDSVNSSFKDIPRVKNNFPDPPLFLIGHHCIGGTVLLLYWWNDVTSTNSIGANDRKKMTNVIVLIRFGAVEVAAPIMYSVVCTTWLVNLRK